MPQKKALGKVMEVLGVSESYLKHGLKNAKSLPDIFKERERKRLKLRELFPQFYDGSADF